MDKLQVLLQEPTVFILGAGASKDYGFPLWEDLKTEFLKKIGETASDLEAPAVEYWLEAIGNNPQKKSVDLMAQQSPDDGGLDLFQKVMGDVFMELEAKDLREGTSGWVEVLCEKLMEIGEDHATLGLLQNFSVISFNYERCFNHRYLKYFIEPLWQSAGRKWDRALNWKSLHGESPSFTRIVHPHGTLGTLSLNELGHSVFGSEGSTFYNPTQGVGFPYGKVANFEKIKRNDQMYFLPVDAFSSRPEPYTQLNGSYRNATNLVNSAKNVVIIGMSPDGWGNQLIAHNTDARYWSTGTSTLSRQITSLGCYAGELAEKL